MDGDAEKYLELFGTFPGRLRNTGWKRMYWPFRTNKHHLMKNTCTVGLGAILWIVLSVNLHAAERRIGVDQPPLPPPDELRERHPGAPPLPPESRFSPDSDRLPDELAAMLQEQLMRATREGERMVEETRRRLPRMRQEFSEMTFGARGPASYRTLVLPMGDAGADAGSVREDLTIMGRVLEKALHPEAERRSNPFRLEFGNLRMGGKNELDALYLEGYGAVFLLEVDYPLAPAPVGDKDAAVGAAEVDEAWEEARREVRGRKGPEPFPNPRERQGPVYEEQRVEGVKVRLLEALRQGRNIRALRPDETLTVVISGAAPAGKVRERARAPRREGGRGGGEREEVREEAGGNLPATGSVMTLQVKKSELEQLAKESLKWDEFVKRVGVRIRLERDEPGVGGQP